MPWAAFPQFDLTITLNWRYYLWLTNLSNLIPGMTYYARFTLWLNTALIRARGRYLETHTERFDIVPLDEVLTNTTPDSTDHFVRIERSKTDFDFEEEKLAKAFSELSLMRREVLRLLFVEEKTPCEIARQLCISPNCVYQFKHQALSKLRRELTKGETQHG